MPEINRIADAESENARIKEYLHEITFFYHRADNRLHPQYEAGWNDAVTAITEKARSFLKSAGVDADTFVDENIRLREVCADVLFNYGNTLPDEIKERLRAALSQA